MSCTATAVLVGFCAFWSGVYVAAKIAAWYYREGR